jgi:hypothetical protein
MRYPASRVLLRLGLFVLFACVVGGAGQSQTRRVLKTQPGLRSSPLLLQLRPGGNTAGFLPAKAYLLAGGHALTVEFLGTPGVMPRMQPKPDSLAGTALKVLYEDLWPGVSVTFGLNPKGSCDATYILAPGAEVSKIRLRYGVPVMLQKDGTLNFQLSSGTVTESSPEAWQEIDGKRVSIAVSFMLRWDEVGFTLGSYDPKFPVTIDPAYR